MVEETELLKPELLLTRPEESPCRSSNKKHLLHQTLPSTTIQDCCVSTSTTTETQQMLEIQEGARTMGGWGHTGLCI